MKPMIKRMGKSVGLVSGAVFALLGSSGVCASETAVYPEGVYASTTLSEAGYDYNAWNVFDGNLSSIWVEGASGTGVGEYLEIQLPQEMVLTGGIIYTGFLQNEDLFWKNAAPAVLEISASGGSTTIDCSTFANSYSEAWGGCYFSLGDGLTHDGSIYVTIRGVREGWKYTDTCLSELTLYGTGAADGVASDLAEVSQEEAAWLGSFAYWLYETHQGNTGVAPADILLEDMTVQDKAMGMYWLQYHGMDERVVAGGEYNSLSKEELRQIWSEVYTDVTEEDINLFMERYVQWEEGDRVYMYGTGDFGAVGEYYFAQPDVIETSGERIVLAGDVMEYADGGQYAPTYRYEVSYEVGEEGFLGKYVLEKMSVAAR